MVIQIVDMSWRYYELLNRRWIFTRDSETITSICVGVSALSSMSAITEGMWGRAPANPRGLPKMVIGRSEAAEWSGF